MLYNLQVRFLQSNAIYTYCGEYIHSVFMIFLLVKLKFFLQVLQNDIGTKILITSKPYREVIGPMLIALKVCKLVCLLAG